jgi:dihydrofolate synthase/folylpolyglutamate synthase
MKAKSRSFHEWLTRIEHFPVSLHSNTDKSLCQIGQVAKNLAVDKTQAKVITVTGTNGKGSCVEMLTSVYVDAGYTVGTYTSPHLFHFNERIRLQKKPVDEILLCEAFEQINFAKQDIELTYFEWVTLVALWIFKKAHLDVIILEVGIGGRLDATNIIDADLAVITSIGLDHTDYLGNTRESIGREKAGIFRPGKLAVCGDPSTPVTIKQEATRIGAQLYVMGEDFDCQTPKNEHSQLQTPKNYWEFHSSSFTAKNLTLPTLLVNNAATVLYSIILMNDLLPVNFTHATQSIIATTLPGRCEVKKLSNGATVIFDVAHNPQAATQLAIFLKKYHSKKITFLFSMLRDKDIQSAVAPLKQLLHSDTHKWHCVELDHPRRASQEKINTALAQYHIIPQWHHDWESAISSIKPHLTKEDVLVVWGSFFVVSEVASLFFFK